MKTVQYRVTLPVDIVEQLTDFAAARHRRPRDVLTQIIGEYCVDGDDGAVTTKGCGKVGRPSKGRPRSQAYYLGRLWLYDAGLGGWCPANVQGGAMSADFDRLADFESNCPERLKAIRDALRAGAGGTLRDARAEAIELFDDYRSPPISDEERTFEPLNQ